jgi:hypothetical protein
LLFLLAVSFLLAGSVRAMPRPRDVGDGVVRLRSTTFLAGWGYDDDGVRVADPPFTAETVGLLVEAGVAPRLTLVGVLPFVWIPSAPATPSTGDAVVGGMLALLEDDPLSVALSLELKVPLYAGAPAVRGRAVDGRPVVGDGQLDLTSGAVLTSTLPLGGAIDLYLGYRLRTGDITDAIVLGGRFGVWLVDKQLFLSLLLDTVTSLAPAQTSGEVVGRGHAAIGPRLSLRVVDRIFLDVGATYVGRGTNAPGGGELTLGLSAGF